MKREAAHLVAAGAVVEARGVAAQAGTQLQQLQHQNRPQMLQAVAAPAQLVQQLWERQQRETALLVAAGGAAGAGVGHRALAQSLRRRTHLRVAQGQLPCQMQVLVGRQTALLLLKAQRDVAVAGAVAGVGARAGAQTQAQQLQEPSLRFA